MFLNHCPKCGGTFFHAPRPGRLKPFAWWNPLTWFSQTWEWNDRPKEIRAFPPLTRNKKVYLFPVDGDKP